MNLRAGTYSYEGVFMGCDPEVFIQSGDGRIVGSEKAIRENGLRSGKIVRDGVQAELNPSPHRCREELALEIRSLLLALRNELKLRDPSYSINMNRVVKLSKKELDSLSDESKKLGCSPSLNAYDSKASVKLSEKFRERSAGGHIHVSTNDFQREVRSAGNMRKLACVFDTVLGNTCVMIDTDEDNARRRRHYGRAGEYRLPKYGLEYRTLSNFWLQSYPILSLVFGLTRQCVNLWNCGYADSILSLVSQEKIRKAINQNDPVLARDNFLGIADYLVEVSPGGYERNIPICNDRRVRTLLYFCEKGIDYWFPLNAMAYWDTDIFSVGGWEKYADFIVRDDMLRKIPEKLD